ncbi:RBR-type E3 ubiquitin transferase [Mycena kentingensis (nom. inval.)]|nr:RBR-type E3 ubiquitin transferase [Mycena kentingensis (nom. inval.)]
MTSRPCKFYAQGRCSYGDRCKFTHGAPAPAPTSPRQPSSPRLKRGEKPCKAWRDTGNCPKGSKCFFAHDPQVREDRLRREQEAAQAEIQRQAAEAEAELARQEAARVAQEALEARQAAARQARLQHEAAQRARQEQIEAQRAETARREATRTFQQLVLGTSLVTYGAGVSIRSVVTGYESCRIHIRNLPLDAKEHEIFALFTQQGIERNRLFLVDMKPFNGRLEATLITTAEEGSAIAIGLEDIEFRSERLQFEVSENASGMGASASRDSDTLTLTWRAPSSTAIATFETEGVARVKVQALNRQICGGRRVHVEMSQPPGGRVFPDTHRSVKIAGLPPLVSHETVVEFAGTFLHGVRFLKPLQFNADYAQQQVEQQVRTLAGHDLLSTDLGSADGDSDGKVTVKFRFSSWDAAKRVEEFFTDKKLLYLGNRNVWSRLPNPHQYVLSVPSQQYDSQRRLWDELASPNPKAASIKVFSPSNSSRVQIRVVGEDKQAVGSLKVRVENLAGGVSLPRDIWHRSLKWGPGREFLDSLHELTGAFARADGRLCVVKVFGDPAAVDRAREMVREEVERLNASEWSIFLKKQSIRFFVQRGLAALKESLGEDYARLEISRGPSKLIVRGGEDARQLVDRLVTESLQEVPNRSADGASCPICFDDDIAQPVTLGCNHTYCMNCLRHYISSDTFPLNCIGNDATCDVPIALPAIQRLLRPPQVQELFDTAYRRHVEQHAEEFKYCRTPDCEQVYRRNTRGVTVTCPSCFAKVCSACDEAAHEGMTCAERRLHNDPGEQERLNDEWAQQSGAKRCPACSVWISKSEGCNHMTCRCGAHMCWICVQQFGSAEETYAHLSAAHGGIFDVPADAAPVPPPRYGLEPLPPDPYQDLLDLVPPPRAQRMAPPPRAPFAFGAAPPQEQNPFMPMNMQALEAARERREAEARERAEALRIYEQVLRDERLRYAEIQRQRQIAEQRLEAEAAAARQRQQQQQQPRGLCIIM